MRNFNGLVGLGRRFVVTACLLFVLAATTNAYSIVMRGGKRIDIPAHFSVTNTTLSYETAPGFCITLQLAAIDIPATEQANNEMPGSLMGRIIKGKEPFRASQITGQTRESKAARSVTNHDLRSFERLRLESERAYEQRLKNQGLPPLAVLRARAAAENEVFLEELSRQRAEAEATERALELQAQIAALSAQLSYLQYRSGDLSPVFPDAFTNRGSPFFDGYSGVDPALFPGQFDPSGAGAFGTFDGSFGRRSQFPGLRRNTVVPSGTRVDSRIGTRGRPHGRSRYR